MGCCKTGRIIKSEKQSKNQHEFSELGLEFGYSYDLNFQYYFSVRGTPSRYSRYLLTVFPEPEKKCSYYLLAALEHPESNQSIEQHHAKMISRYFQDKLSSINWNQSQKGINEQICQMFMFENQSSTRKASPNLKDDQRPPTPSSTAQSKGQKFLKMIKFCVLVIDKKIFIIQGSDTVGFTIKNTMIANQQLSDRQNSNETKISSKEKRQTDFLFFGDPELMDSYENTYIWNKYYRRLSQEFPRQREEIGWKFTLGQIQQVYKSALKELFDDLATEKKNRFSKGYAELGIIVIGGF